MSTIFHDFIQFVGCAVRHVDGLAQKFLLFNEFNFMLLTFCTLLHVVSLQIFQLFLFTFFQSLYLKKIIDRAVSTYCNSLIIDELF